MTPPIVSVVLPTRNRAAMIPLALRSVLRQTVAALEVLVIDDASTDETPRVLAELADDRIRVLRQDSWGGAAAARNRAIRESRAEFIAFLDDDDEWLPNKLEAQLAVFRSGGPRLGIVYSSYLVIERETGTVLGRKVAEHRGNLFKDLLERNVVGGTSSVVVRRECFEKVGLFDECLPSFQDYDLWIRLAREFEYDFVEDDLSKYYVHEKKIWSDPDALDRGIQIMAAKYASTELHRNLANQSLRVGLQYCYGGRMDRGRKAFARSIRLFPWEPRPYLNFGLSLLGTSPFRFAHRTWQRVTGSFLPTSKEGSPEIAATVPRRVGE